MDTLEVFPGMESSAFFSETSLITPLRRIGVVEIMRLLGFAEIMEQVETVHSLAGNVFFKYKFLEACTCL